MKKVLILTAAFGEGHNAAARNIREALEALDAGARVEVLDLLQVAYGRVNQLARAAYLGMVRYAPAVWRTVYGVLNEAPSLTGSARWARLRQALAGILSETQPDCVVSTYPLYGGVIAECLRDHADRPFRLYTIITDSISVHAAWHRAPSDLFCVANDATAEVLLSAGVARERIAVTGFPVSPEFLNLAVPELEIPAEGRPRRILYIVNTARKKVGRTLEEILELPRTELTVTVGRDGEMKARLQARLRHYGERVRLLGWTNLMPRLLCTHHLAVTKAGGATVQEAIAARCPVIVNQVIPGQEEGNARLVEESGFGCVAEKRRQTLGAIESAFADGARRWRDWRSNLARASRPGSAYRIAELILSDEEPSPGPRRRNPPLFSQGASGFPGTAPSIKPSSRGGPLLCDFHIHTNYSDGKLTVGEVIDFYGAHGFDCLCITDHLADPRRLIGKLARLSRLTLAPAQLDEYFEVIRREGARAWRKYRMLVLAGLEFNKDGYTRKTSAHLLGIDLQEPIPAHLDLPETIARVHSQGGLAVASHPHLMRSEWGKNTLYLWENQETFAPLLDAWEIANRDNIFSPVALKRLPYIANSDFHKPKHIYSWKTVLHCEKEVGAIKDCIRRNERVSITLYRPRDLPPAPGEPILLPLPPAEGHGSPVSAVTA